ncbi:MAG: YdeI/OmpD-associated family protein [Candidatus Gracilibacteria bacterium]
MKITVSKNLKREPNEVPVYIEKALIEHKVVDLYKARPSYQQNDYISWITRGVREETKQKRLDQMLSELKAGNVYMKMKWHE